MSGKGKGEEDFASCAAQGKFLICHNAGPEKAEKVIRICVDGDAVADHLDHGDVPCLPPPPTPDGGRRTLSTLPGAQAAIDHSPFAVLAILGGVVLWAYKTAKARNDKAVTEEQEVNEDAELV